MGLCVIPIHEEKIAAIPAAMAAIGLPIVRTENRPQGIYYFYEQPRRSNGRPPRREHAAFWINHQTKGRPRLAMGGMGRSSKLIFSAFHIEGISVKYETFAEWRALISGQEGNEDTSE